MATNVIESRTNYAFVKGGMPVMVSGTYTRDENGEDLMDIEVRWSNTEKPVTEKFLASLSKQDWERINESLFDA